MPVDERVCLVEGAVRAEWGTAAEVRAFFDTVGCRLEDGRRGSLFPLLMAHLEGARITGRGAQQALAELTDIEARLGQVPAEQILGAVQGGARNGREAFGELVERLRGVLIPMSGAPERVLYLDMPAERRKRVRAGLGMLVGGVLFATGAHRWAAGWVLMPFGAGDTGAGFGLWRVGLMVAPLGAAQAAMALTPAVQYWMGRVQWLVWGLAVVAALGLAFLVAW